jgi:hypothetical protein
MLRGHGMIRLVLVLDDTVSPSLSSLSVTNTAYKSAVWCTALRCAIFKAFALLVCYATFYAAFLVVSWTRQPYD